MRNNYDVCCDSVAPRAAPVELVSDLLTKLKSVTEANRGVAMDIRNNMFGVCPNMDETECSIDCMHDAIIDILNLANQTNEILENIRSRL